MSGKLDFQMIFCGPKIRCQRRSAIVSNKEEVYASLEKRFVAFLIDNLFFGIPLCAGAAISDLPMGSILPVQNQIPLILLLVGLGLFIGNVVWLGQMGQTIGKKIFKIYCGDENRMPIGIPKAFVRELFKIISAIPMYLGFLWMIWNINKQTWHDSIVGSFVYRSPLQTRMTKIRGAF